MLKEVFEKDFYRTNHPKNGEMINVIEREFDGDFTLCDSKSCKGWKGRKACALNDICDHVNLFIKSNLRVSVVSMDNVLAYINHKIPDNADYVLCSDDIFRIVELTCMEEKYVMHGSTTYPLGKRAHAQSQCEKLILMLYECGPVRMFVEHHSIKESIFSWRKTDIDFVEGNDMAYYGLMQQEIDGVRMSLPMSFDFRFREICYPNVLHWA